eukprot:SAG11_NODE_124_length_15798_cov_14.675776_8_plen_55_part_00
MYAHNGLLQYENPSKASLAAQLEIERLKSNPSAREQVMCATASGDPHHTSNHLS